jgi:hypothetical protein
MRSPFQFTLPLITHSGDGHPPMTPAQAIRLAHRAQGIEQILGRAR